jgi:hypothetical protein
MPVFVVSETFPATTLKQSTFLRFDDSDVKCKDQTLRQLILKYDVHYSKFQEGQVLENFLLSEMSSDD